MEFAQERADVCVFCGATQTRRLGHCTVCDMAVCEKCGSAQYSAGHRTVTHNECLAKHTEGFTMIRFLP